VQQPRLLRATPQRRAVERECGVAGCWVRTPVVAFGGDRGRAWGRRRKGKTRPGTLQEG
jgi:hypothetical protein